MRTKVVRTRVTAEEKAQMCAVAEAEGRSLSGLIRFATLRYAERKSREMRGEGEDARR